MSVNIKIRDGMSNVTEADLNYASEFHVSGQGVNDLATDFIATQDTGSNRKTAVTGGLAYVSNRSGYTRGQDVTKFYAYTVSDTSTLIDVTPNTTLATRIDYLCLKHDSSATPNADGTNVGSLVMVEGTVNNTAPTIPNNYLVLARYDLPMSFTGVTNAMITDMRVQSTLKKFDWNLIANSEDPLYVGGTLAVVQYVSSTSIKIYGDWTSIIGKYTKLKFTNSSVKYAVVTDDGSYSSNYTTYTIRTGGAYTLTNAAISKVYYSVAKNPIGFPDSLNVIGDDPNNLTSFERQVFIDGGCQISQEGSKTLTSSYKYGGTDLFLAKGAGSAVSAGTIAQVTSPTVTSLSGYADGVNGVTLTGSGEMYFSRRVPALDALKAKNKTYSFAVEFYHNVGSTINVVLKVNKPNTSDTYSAKTNISTSSTQTAASGATTTLYIENVSLGDVSNGFELEVVATTGAITTKSFELANWRGNRGAVTLPYNNKPYPVELFDIKRFYQVVGSGFLGKWYASTAAQLGGAFPVAMRTTPTLTIANSTPQIDEIGVAGRTGSGSTLATTVFSSSGSAAVNIDGFTGAGVGGIALGRSNFLICDARITA